MNEFVVSGNINDRSFGITQETFERLKKVEPKRRSDSIALYNFYCYTTKYQNTNSIWCTTGFAAKGVGWSEKKLIAVKKVLISLDLIKDKVERKEGKITKHYIEVRYVLSQIPTTPPETNPVDKVKPDQDTDKCLITITDKCLGTISKNKRESSVFSKKSQAIEEELNESMAFAKEDAVLPSGKFDHDSITENFTKYAYGGLCNLVKQDDKVVIGNIFYVITDYFETKNRKFNSVKSLMSELKQLYPTAQKILDEKGYVLFSQKLEEARSFDRWNLETILKMK